MRPNPPLKLQPRGNARHDAVPIRDRTRQNQCRRPGSRRPRAPDAGRRQCARFRQRRDRRCAALPRHSLYRADPGRELSRVARQHRQLSRQFLAADAALPARGGRRRHRPRLCKGYRQGDGRRGAFQCRADARLHGHVQRLVRPHADARARRHRPGRCGQAPAVDRLDPHRARPGRAGARIHQMGRPAGLARRRARSDPARHLDRQHRAAGPGLHQFRRRIAGDESLRATAGDRRRSLHADRLDRGAGRSGEAGGGDAQGRQAGADPRRPRLAQRGGLERPRRARRGAQCARRQRSENRRSFPDRSSALSRRAARGRRPRASKA